MQMLLISKMRPMLIVKTDDVVNEKNKSGRMMITLRTMPIMLTVHKTGPKTILSVGISSFKSIHPVFRI